jgi:uncharacterized membrane protein
MIDPRFAARGTPPTLQKSPRINVGESERTASLAAGAILAVFGITRQSFPGWIIAGVGGAMLYRGFTGHCHMYDALDIDTATDEARALHVEQAFLINRTPEDLYGYWRDLTNLPRIMTHLQSVTAIDERRSHWVAHAPRIAGGSVEWDAEIISDEPNRLIAWRSLVGADVDNSGEVRFARAPGDRGTEVHVTMKYAPPGGRLGQLVATLSGENPNKQLRDDLRTFKRVMELGEAPTTVGQSHGTCTGTGVRSPATRNSVLPNAS